MADGADACTDDGLVLLALHDAGLCEDYCPYCDDDEVQGAPRRARGLTMDTLGKIALCCLVAASIWFGVAYGHAIRREQEGWARVQAMLRAQERRELLDALRAHGG